MNKTDLTLTGKEAEAAFLKNNGHNLNELDLSEPQAGWFHFTNGTCYPKIIPWLTVDGVYVEKGYYITEYDSGETYSKSKASRKLRRRGYKLQHFWAVIQMLNHAEQLNPVLKALGWPEIKGEYWSEEEKEYDYSNPTEHTPRYDSFDVGGNNLDPYTTYPTIYMKARGIVQDDSRKVYDFTH